MKDYEKILRVRETDLDELQHVNNVQYVQWIQDISKEHWLHVAPAEFQESGVWVVLRHEISYRSAAALGDTIQIKTRVMATEGATSRRRVRMYHAPSGRLLLESHTDWCLLNAASMKPMRIPDAIRDCFLQD